MSTTESDPATPVATIPKCPDCNGAGGWSADYAEEQGEYAGEPEKCPACGGSGTDQFQLRLVVIATFAHAISPDARAGSTLGMLRDAQAHIDYLNGVLLVKRAEGLLEAAEVLRACGLWQAAGVLEKHLTTAPAGS